MQMAGMLMTGLCSPSWAQEQALLGSRDLLPTPTHPVGKRGDGSGRFPGATSPTTWSATEKVAWSVPMPNWSNASPLVVGDKVITMAEPSTILCFDAKTGTRLWLNAADHPHARAPALHRPGSA